MLIGLVQLILMICATICAISCMDEHTGLSLIILSAVIVEVIYSIATAGKHWCDIVKEVYNVEDSRLRLDKEPRTGIY